MLTLSSYISIKGVSDPLSVFSIRSISSFIYSNFPTDFYQDLFNLCPFSLTSDWVSFAKYLEKNNSDSFLLFLNYLDEYLDFLPNKLKIISLINSQQNSLEDFVNNCICFFSLNTKLIFIYESNLSKFSILSCGDKPSLTQQINSSSLLIFPEMIQRVNSGMILPNPFIIENKSIVKSEINYPLKEIFNLKSLSPEDYQNSFLITTSNRKNFFKSMAKEVPNLSRAD